MTRPTDAAIARAFWEIRPDLGRFARSYRDQVIERAHLIDAESPAGTVDEICDCGYVRGSFGCDDSHKNTRKVTTPPERVQIPAESEHDAAALEIGRKAWADVPDAAEWQREIRGTEPAKRTCTIPTCRAEMRPGLRCSSPHCGLKDTTK